MNEKKELTDRELLLLAYGAMLACGSSNYKQILEMIQMHLYPPVAIIQKPLDSYDT